MACITYVDKAFRAATLSVIQMADSICREYQRQGYMLTLRQLYYQFVSRGYIANKDTEYDRLGSIINDARLAGLLDWDFLEDRTRNLQSNTHWSSPESIIRAAAKGYMRDRWENQPNHVEVWVEKEALAGIVERVSDRLDVSYFSCRGYVSQSEMHAAAMRMVGYEEENKEVTILHLGDHDPSGIDMTRDIQDRLAMFGSEATVDRIALNMDQVRQYNPPPNPAKLTDSRCTSYIANYGNESWELDALDPAALAALIESHVLALRDEDLWEETMERERQERTHLTLTHENWSELTEHLDETYA